VRTITIILVLISIGFNNIRGQSYGNPSGKLKGVLYDAYASNFAEDITLQLIPDSTWKFPGILEAESDFLGRYEFTYPPPGTYTLRIRFCYGTDTIISDSILIIKDQTTELDIDLSKYCPYDTNGRRSCCSSSLNPNMRSYYSYRSQPYRYQNGKPRRWKKKRKFRLFRRRRHARVIFR